MAHAGGRPPLWDNPEDLILAVENYFTWVKGEWEDQIVTPKRGDPYKERIWKRDPEHITITGLAIFLGFESRQSIYAYEDKGQFSYIIKSARLRVENSYEQNLYGTTPTGSIFALKNMGWKDKTESEVYGKDGAPVIKIIMPNGE